MNPESPDEVLIVPSGSLSPRERVRVRVPRFSIKRKQFTLPATLSNTSRTRRTLTATTRPQTHRSGQIRTKSNKPEHRNPTTANQTQPLLTTPQTTKPPKTLEILACRPVSRARKKSRPTSLKRKNRRLQSDHDSNSTRRCPHPRPHPPRWAGTAASSSPTSGPT